MSVCAVVVTFNRRTLLTECLAAVLGQTRRVDRVVVVDNASTDGTPELLHESGLLDRPQVEYMRLERNEGSSGGFAVGIDAARRGAEEWIWIMDDDAEPRPDALERLLASPLAQDARTVALCPRVEFPSAEIDAIMRGDFRRRLRPLRAHDYVEGRPLGYTSFVGPLVRTSALRATGLPRAEFFVWGDDVEWSLRLRRQGALRLVPSAIVLHKPLSHGSYETARSRLLNRILPVTFHPTPLERFWQNLCGLRNYLWIKREYEGQGPLSAAGTTLQFLVKHVLWDDRPRTRVPWIVRFARDGRAGRFVNITPQRWAERSRSGEL